MTLRTASHSLWKKVFPRFFPESEVQQGSTQQQESRVSKEFVKDVQIGELDLGFVCSDLLFNMQAILLTS
jgi:hypothetical protein